MAWLGEGLSTLRGQITSVANFTKEVLSDGKEEDESDVSGLGAAERNIRELEEICAAKDLEISKLRRRNDQLEVLHGSGGSSHDPDKEVPESEQLEFLSTESWHQHDLQASGSSRARDVAADQIKEVPKNFVLVPEEKEVSLMRRIDHLEAENRLMRKTCSEYEEQVAELLDEKTKYGSSTSEESADVSRLAADLHAAAVAAALQADLSPEDASGLREQLQAAECRVADLEAELQRVCRELGEYRAAGEDGSEGGDKVAPSRQAGVTQRTATAERSVQEAGALLGSINIASIIESIGDDKQQQQIYGLLNALELENQVLKLRNAELEMTAGNIKGIDSSVEFKVDHFNGNKQVPTEQPKQASEESNVPEAQMKAASSAALGAEVSALSAAKECLTVELESMAAMVQDLEARNISLQEENATLSTGLEELDQQQQIVIDQLLQAKKSVQKENASLKQETAELQLKLEETLKSQRAEVESKKTERAEVTTETTDLVTEGTEDNRKQYDDEIYKNLLQAVTFELPKEFYHHDKYEVDSVGLVKVLVKVCEESRWKKDTLERKISECMKEVRDMQSVLNERDATVASLEKETDLLRGHVKALVEQVTSEQSDGDALAVIPENSEEMEMLEQRSAMLETQVQDAMKDKEQLLAEISTLRSESEASANKLIAEQRLLEELKHNLTQVSNDKTVLETEKKTLQARITSSAESSSKSSDLECECSRLQALASLYSEQLQEAEAKKQQLELEASELKLQLREVAGELAELKMASQGLQEKVRHLHKLETDVQEWESRCQEMINAQNSLRKEITGLENSALVMGRKLEESVEAKQSAESKCSSLEEMLRSQGSMMVDERNYKEQLNTAKQAHLELENKCQQLSTELTSKDVEVENSQKMMRTLEEQLNNLDASKTAVDSECQRLLLERSAADHNVLESSVRDQEAIDHEVHKWKSMATGAERQLDEALSAKAELEAECRRLFGIETKVHNQEHLERQVAHLTEVSRTTEQRLQEALEGKEVLEGNLNQLRACVEDQKNLEQEATEWRTKSNAAELQLHDALASGEKLSAEAGKLREFESECLKSRGIIEVQQHQLNSVLSSNNELKNQLELTRTQLQRLHHVDQEIVEWKEKARVTESQLDEALQRKLEVEREYKKMEDLVKSIEMEKLDKEKPVVSAVDSNVSSDNVTASGNIEAQLENMKQERLRLITSLDDKIQQLGSLKSENTRLMQIISEEKNASGALEDENRETMTQIQFQSSEASVMAKETIANLSKIIQEKDLEILTLTQKSDALYSRLQEASNVKPAGVTSEEKEALLKELQRLGSERDELISTVQVKHSESLQYHAEIQRLSGILNQELNKSEQIRQQYTGLVQKYEDKQKALVNSENELIAVKQRLDRLEQSARKQVLFQGSAKQAESRLEDPDSVKSKDEVIAMKTELAKELGMELKTREKEIELLKLEVVELRNNGNVSEGGQGRGQETQQNKRSLVEELQAERTRLMNNLSQEATRNKYLQNEVQEQHEKESSLLRELDRLREHLVSVEDTYTQETVAQEDAMRDLRSRLAQAEDRAKTTATAYTSANIRANQHVESLQGQARIAGQQRDDVAARLAAADEQVQRHAAALRNLQAVLEQFQRDKEMDISSATGKLAKQLQSVESRNMELCAEVASLQGQLTEAKEGLSAATRLGEQLDKKAQSIATLKEEVERLNGQLNTAESREKSASLSSEGKVDKYLVKNLLIGFLVAPSHTKQQALRIVSTVLDFNHDERCRVGLEPGSQPTSGWFKSLMHPGNPAGGNQSLAEAFVRFLESESRPQPQLRLLPSIQDAPQRENKGSETPVQDSRSPLLLTEVQLPTFTQFPVARSSSSILKDVLKDS